MKQYVVDAFTDSIFHGNPAAVCILEKWLAEDLMKNITAENNLSETAFAVKEGDHYHLRWFTPGGEINLCGHATLATAYILMNFYEKNIECVRFQTWSGELTVEKKEDLYEMDFPAYELKQVPITEQMIASIGAKPTEAYMGRDLLCVFDNTEIVMALNPDSEKIKTLDGLLFHATAQGNETNLDCISRSFGPKCGIIEDPVCGSGHCHIVPYWSKRLGKENIKAYQASKRGGTLYCRMNGARVKMAGKATLFCESNITL